ncbi:IS66 family transposase [Microbacterium sp. A93]
MPAKPQQMKLMAWLDTRQHEVLRFAEDLRIAHTNNVAEHEVRPS